MKKIREIVLTAEVIWAKPKHNPHYLIIEKRIRRISVYTVKSSRGLSALIVIIVLSKCVNQTTIELKSSTNSLMSYRRTNSAIFPASHLGSPRGLYRNCIIMHSQCKAFMVRKQWRCHRICKQSAYGHQSMPIGHYLAD